MRKPGPMDGAHRMDWAILDLGHRRASKRTVYISDMEVHVWGLDEVSGSDLPLAVIILSHGWANRARDMEAMAGGLIGEIGVLARTGPRRRTRDVVVATLDGRNHGERRRVRDSGGWSGHRNGLLSTVAGLAGGVMDHQYIMDLLPSYLFPTAERDVEEFMLAGFSMGGHVVWRLLREDARVRVAVPICSMPSEALGRHLVARADAPVLSGGERTYAPPAVRDYLLVSPSNVPGKKILALHGELDAVVPWRHGAAEWDTIVAAAIPGEVSRWIDPHHGHVVSPEIVRRAAAWFWYWGLSDTEVDTPSV